MHSHGRYLLLAYSVASLASAQVEGPAKAATIKYQPLRQDEDWSALATTAASGDLFDPIKYIALRDDGSMGLSFGGEGRLRLEAWDGFRFGAPATADNRDVFLLTRARLHGDLHLGPQVRLFAEGISAWATDRDLVGVRRASDVDSVDLAQGFLDVKTPLLDGWTLTLRPGRQQFLFGRQRLVSPLPWPNTLRAWDGGSAIIEGESIAVTAFLTQFVQSQKYRFNDVQRGVDFGGVYATRRATKEQLGIDVYALWLDRQASSFNGTVGANERWTLGTRLWQPPASSRVDFDIEAAWQFGEIGQADVNAYMVALLAGHTFAGDLQPRAWLGFDYASGDRRPGGSVQTFQQLFPLGHAYFGAIDAIGRQNIIDASGGVEAKLSPSLKTALEAHAFWLADRNDGLYDAAGTVLRPGGSARGRQVGFEVDWTAQWQVNRHLSALLGVSYFLAGDVVEQSGPSDDISFAYAQATFVF